MIDLLQKNQMGLFGERVETPEDKKVHECCYDRYEPPCFFRVTVIDYDAKTEYV